MAPEGRKVGSLKRREPSGQMRDEIARRCGAKHIWNLTCTKHLSEGPLFEVDMSNKCRPLWRNKYRLRNYHGFRNCVSETTSQKQYIYIRFRNWKLKIQKLRLGNCTFTIQKLCLPDSETRNSRFRNYVSETELSGFRNFACPIQKLGIQDSETTSQKMQLHDSETCPIQQQEIQDSETSGETGGISHCRQRLREGLAGKRRSGSEQRLAHGSRL